VIDVVFKFRRDDHAECGDAEAATENHAVRTSGGHHPPVNSPSPCIGSDAPTPAQTGAVGPLIDPTPCQRVDAGSTTIRSARPVFKLAPNIIYCQSRDLVRAGGQTMQDGRCRRDEQRIRGSRLRVTIDDQTVVAAFGWPHERDRRMFFDIASRPSSDVHREDTTVEHHEHRRDVRRTLTRRRDKESAGAEP